MQFSVENFNFFERARYKRSIRYNRVGAPRPRKGRVLSILVRSFVHESTIINSRDTSLASPLAS